jgi:oxygen-independent coproporphyrinogen-3 oxidase
LIYWRGGDYLGIGPGAHGRLTQNGNRYATQTPLAPGGWLNQVETLGHGESPKELLSETDRVTELVLMGLRLTEGMPTYRLNDAAFDTLWTNVDPLVADGWLTIRDDRLIVTPKGRPVLNGVLRELLRGY